MSKVKIIGESVPNIPWQDRRGDSKAPVWRYDSNPIIKRNPCDGVARIFNSAVVPYKGAFVGLFRAEQPNGLPFLRFGESKDGINFTFSDRRLEIYNEDGSLVTGYDYQYDPRLLKIDDWYYAIWCESMISAPKYPTLAACRTKDFKKFYRVENPVLPPQRNGVFFPRKVNGEYLLLSRPSDLGHTPFGDIFLSKSKDMIYWGKHQCIMQSGDGKSAWGGLKIGAGPAPIETSEGWLMIYHGVIQSCSGYIYSMGAAILDADDPAKVLYRCRDYLLTPEEDYETTGFVPNVVFPCAAVTDADTGRIAIYYGAADTFVGLAFAEVDELCDYIKRHS